MPQIVDDDTINILDWLRKEKVRFARQAEAEPDRAKKEDLYRRATFHEDIAALVNAQPHVLSRQQQGIASCIEEIFGRWKWRCGYWSCAREIATYINTCG